MIPPVTYYVCSLLGVEDLHLYSVKTHCLESLSLTQFIRRNLLLRSHGSILLEISRGALFY